MDTGFKTCCVSPIKNVEAEARSFRKLGPKSTYVIKKPGKEDAKAKDRL